MHPTGNGSFTGSCPVWPTGDYLRVDTWCVFSANPHFSASRIYSIPINQHAHEGQEDEEGGKLGVFLY